MSLKATIIDHIRAQGPMRLADYMARCNAHYYATRVPFGALGDFITAPEISQVFGELIGLWAADLWQRAGAPPAFDLIELGPGRGTLMQDALRATKAIPGFQAAARVHLVETSPALRAEQQQRMTQAQWHDDLHAIPPGAPAIILANEFFDALPIEQWIGETARCIGVEGDALVWQALADADTRETSPASCDLVQAIGRRLSADGGALLVIDYGDAHLRGDTLQAVKTHRYADPLAHPGEQDLTAHVDFATLAKAARSGGCTVYGPVSQGHFLRQLGLDARTAQLARANPVRGDAICAASARLANPDEMGALFKVMALQSAAWPAPAGFA